MSTKHAQETAERSAADVGDDGEFQITFLSIWFLSATDLGALIRDENAARKFMRTRGRPGWMDEVRGRFESAKLGYFEDASPQESAYGLTDRHGRQTFSAEFAASFMPVLVPVRRTRKHRVGSLSWSVQEARIGASGALSIRALAELDDSAPISVDPVIQAFHQVRNELEHERAALVNEFARSWARVFPEYPLARVDQDRLRRDSYYYEILDLTFGVSGRVMAPKDLYQNGPVRALRQLSGLTRMSLVWEGYDELSVRRMGQFDLGSRADELWIANEERLVRSHPERGLNKYVDAFFEDVKLGIELVLQQAASLNYLAAWLRTNRWRFLDKLLAPEQGTGGIAQTRETLAELAGASDLFSDRIRVEDNSGHSFFRRLLNRTAELFQLEDRRRSCRATFADLFALADAASSQAVSETNLQLQNLGVEIADASRRLTRNTYIVSVAAVLIASASLFFSLR